jgi:LacI family transcriptional regulator
VPKRTTIADVAQAAGVSMATVSKAVNNRYGVRAETAQRVRAIASDLGYESSLVASSMRSTRTGVIGVLVPSFEPFSTEVLKGASVALKSSDYDLLAYTPSDLDDRLGWEQRSLSRLAGTLVDGAILVTPTVVEVRSDIPVVAIDPHTGPVGLPSVESDSLTGAWSAVRHLIGLGHRTIGFLAGRADLRSSMLREAGYRRALAEAGIAFDSRLVRVGGYEPEISREPALELLRQPDRPTAVFAANDLSAISVVEVAQELGLRVPDDLSVVGFDDIPEAARLDPPLTTVQQALNQMGATGMTMLLELLAGRVPRHERVVLPTRLLVRATTGPAPAQRRRAAPPAPAP